VSKRVASYATELMNYEARSVRFVCDVVQASMEAETLLASESVSQCVNQSASQSVSLSVNELSSE